MIRVKFINDAGTITYNQEADVLEIHFDGSGSYQQHLKSLSIAQDMARIYHCNSFLLSYRCFMKLSPAEFMVIFLRWIHDFQHPAAEESINQEVNIYLSVAPDAYDTVATYFTTEGMLAYHDMVCYLFSSIEDAYDFIQVKSL